MNYTQSIGNLNELLCLSKFIELGYECSIPYGNGAKYDFIADVNGKMLRIQCKSSSRVRSSTRPGEYDEAFSFTTSATTTNTQKTTRHLYDKTQIDYFATSFEGQIYLIPVEECSTAKTLRLKPPSNNNKNYNKAEDYEIEKIIPPSDELNKSKEEFLQRMENLQNKTIELHCKNCNAVITKYSLSGLCSKCQSISTRKVTRPTRNELKQLIKTYPFTQIAKMYNVSDSAIRKWCKAENLPFLSAEIKKIADKDWELI